MDFSSKMIFIRFVTFALVVGNAFSNTGSGVSVNTAKVDTAIRRLREELGVLRQEINYDRSARKDLDRDLSDLTRRYRQLLLEYNEIKDENQKMVDKFRNYTDGKYNVLMAEIKSRIQIPIQKGL